MAIVQKVSGSGNAVPSDPSRVTKDSGYVSCQPDSVTTKNTGAVGRLLVEGSTFAASKLDNTVQEDAKELGADAELLSLRTLSSYVDLGLQGRLRGIEFFVRDIVDSLSLDIPDIVEDRKLVAESIQDAVRLYSYALEKETRLLHASDERKAAVFVRQESG